MPQEDVADPQRHCRHTVTLFLRSPGNFPHTPLNFHQKLILARHVLYSTEKPKCTPRPNWKALEITASNSGVRQEHHPSPVLPRLCRGFFCTATTVIG